MPPFNSFLLTAYIILLNLTPVLTMHGVIPHRYHYLIIDLATLVPIYIAIKNLKVVLRRPKKKIGIAIFHLVTAFQVLSFFSVTLFLQQSNPSHLESFAYGVHLCVLPISVFYAAYCLTPIQGKKTLLIGCLLNAIAVVYGIILQTVRPEFYKEYLTVIVLEQKGYEFDWQLFSRLQSYFGSTTIGTITAVSISWINICNAGPRLATIGTSIFLTGSILSHQRGSFVATALAIVALLFSKSKTRSAKIQVLLISIITALISLAILENLYPETSILLQERSNETLGELFATRGYGLAISYLQDFPFGIGLGGSLSASDAAGLASRGQVVDANFMRILVDLGLQGLALFVSLLIVATIGATTIDRSLGWLSLISGFVVIWLGSNTLDNFYSAHLFWLSLGILAAKVSFARKAEEF